MKTCKYVNMFIDVDHFLKNECVMLMTKKNRQFRLN